MYQITKEDKTLLKNLMKASDKMVTISGGICAYIDTNAQIPKNILLGIADDLNRFSASVPAMIRKEQILEENIEKDSKNIGEENVVGKAKKVIEKRSRVKFASAHDIDVLSGMLKKCSVALYRLAAGEGHVNNIATMRKIAKIAFYLGTDVENYAVLAMTILRWYHVHEA